MLQGTHNGVPRSVGSYMIPPDTKIEHIESTLCKNGIGLEGRFGMAHVGS